MSGVKVKEQAATPTRSAVPGGGGSGGGGTGGGHDPCDITQDAPLNSPNPAVVPSLSVGEFLDLTVSGVPPRRVLKVSTAAGAVAGSLTHLGHLQIVRCIDDGNTYRAEVIQKSGGSVVLRIERS